MKSWFVCSVVVAMTLGLALPAYSSSGYWRFTGYRVEPDPSSLPKGMPAKEISGGVQVKPGANGSLSMSFANQDPDKALYSTELLFGFQVGRSIETLLPGEKIPVRAQLSFGGNAKAAALPSDASAQIAVGNGDYLLSITDARIGQPASAEGVIVVEGGGPGATMEIRITAYIGTYGAFSGRMVLEYAWAEGSPQTMPTPADGGWARTPDGYPSIAGDWAEGPYTVHIVQHDGGRFTATCDYDGKSWRVDGTISRDGAVDSNLVHTSGLPSSALGYAQHRQLELSPDGKLLQGQSTFEGGSHPLEWRRL